MKNEYVAPRWVHGVALLTVAAALPLFFLGADVTTGRFGMADSRGLVRPDRAIEEMLTQERSYGWRIEHLHRLAGWFIGMCGMALCASLWLTEKRRWVQWLGTAALGLIIVQGVLGIFRVQINALLGPELAWVHGSFAPIVLGSLVAAAVVTSPSWTRERIEGTAGESLRRLAGWTCVLVYVQLVVGGMVRHQDFFLGARLHVFLAFVVAAAVLWLVKWVGDSRNGIGWLGKTLFGLLGLQVLLGIEAWIIRFHQPGSYWNQLQPWAPGSPIPQTLHFVVGAFLFAGCVALTVSLYRPGKPSWREDRGVTRESEKEVLV